MTPSVPDRPALLAVDLGVRTGLAAYGRDGRLRWVRSHNLGTAARLRRAVRGLLAAEPGLERLVLEGGGRLADLWLAEAAAVGLPARVVDADVWRRALLYPRERRDAATAKVHAELLARRIVTWSELRGVVSLRHDAAEAVCVGLWAVVEAGWLARVPEAVRRG